MAEGSRHSSKGSRNAEVMGGILAALAELKHSLAEVKVTGAKTEARLALMEGSIKARSSKKSSSSLPLKQDSSSSKGHPSEQNSPSTTTIKSRPEVKQPTRVTPQQQTTSFQSCDLPCQLIERNVTEFQSMSIKRSEKCEVKREKEEECEREKKVSDEENTRHEKSKHANESECNSTRENELSELVEPNHFQVFNNFLFEFDFDNPLFQLENEREESEQNSPHEKK